jgi:hypothetical protein
MCPPPASSIKMQSTPYGFMQIRAYVYINIVPKLCYKHNPKILYLLTTSCSKIGWFFFILSTPNIELSYFILFFYICSILLWPSVSCIASCFDLSCTFHWPLLNFALTSSTPCFDLYCTLLRPLLHLALTSTAPALAYTSPCFDLCYTLLWPLLQHALTFSSPCFGLDRTLLRSLQKLG